VILIGMRTRKGNTRSRAWNALQTLIAFLVLIYTFYCNAGDNQPDVQPAKILEEMEHFGSFEYYPSSPGVLHLYRAIAPGDEFDLRKALSTHSIHTLSISSPGGDVSAGLNIAAAVSDRNINSYIPKNGNCESACSFIFFAGNNRKAGDGSALGVHQFAPQQSRITESRDIYQRAQQVMSNILGMISTFDLPAFVTLRMLDTPPERMYYFNKTQLQQINRGDISAADEVDQIYRARGDYIAALEAQKTLAATKTELIAPSIPKQNSTIEPKRTPSPKMDKLYPTKENSKYLLQLAKFRDLRNARSLAYDLQRVGYSTDITESGELKIVSVFAGDETTAAALQEQIKKEYALSGEMIPYSRPPVTTQSPHRVTSLRISLTDVTWLNVKGRDGVEIYNGLAEQGRIIELEGVPPISLIIGRADAVEVFVFDGRSIDLTPHTRKNVARITLD